ncbi:TPA: rhamnulose-1-phosphate aldolase [Clostridioides difficile]|uniref:Rhamnulose-1-phosphate aldolase n=2 Tax=Clostridioides difficile TaxID=1496 RepID=A0AC59FVS7_CLODI|nr:rhamnulose-1-phosphate aldolase [Clostridioides difficile]AKP41503.1 rhamnulose-1-phosphate aldolase [Clostridioides difficile ATCC 9689 = DSM 1296]AVI11113.1 rhamnulose-1-phosphate aldolase [Clostridioides difficile]AVI58853.1 rhamnulose-1-phosphate aldolase [Clostridioides difficile]AXU85375.1 rhamnulose-1-phosphate aldolase [Clostridioides difficile]EGT3641955.1 rhamnulose-1-phosphate aldolase [Clostridioides difficile]
MSIMEMNFIKDFMKITYDAWLKGWHERNGGNITYRLTPEEISGIKEFITEEIEYIPIGVTVENLANEYFLVTGSGKFMRNISINTVQNVGIVKIDEKGENYAIVWGLDKAKPTSEFPSHLMSHSIKKDKTNGLHRVIMHSHTTNLIALTFILPLEGKVFTRELWEMATECPAVFPEGIGIVPWMVPGGIEIAKATQNLMEKHNIVIWAHHGTFCSGETLDLTFGLMDTVEKSAEILVKVISMGGKKQTITGDNFRDLSKNFKVSISEDYLY